MTRQHLQYIKQLTKNTTLAYQKDEGADGFSKRQRIRSRARHIVDNDAYAQLCIRGIVGIEVI